MKTYGDFRTAYPLGHYAPNKIGKGKIEIDVNDDRLRFFTMEAHDEDSLMDNFIVTQDARKAFEGWFMIDIPRQMSNTDAIYNAKLDALYPIGISLESNEFGDNMIQPIAIFFYDESDAIAFRIKWQEYEGR